jgi:hypothetical protein
VQEAYYFTACLEELKLAVSRKADTRPQNHETHVRLRNGARTEQTQRHPDWRIA